MTKDSSSTRNYLTEITYGEGAEIRICEQTASRDYTAKIVPGTYPITYTTVNYHPVSDGERPYYGLIDVEIITPTRTVSSAEFCGVAYASETVQGKRTRHTITRYAYELTTDKV